MGFTFYKANQGRYARALTALSVGVLLVFGCWELYMALGSAEEEDVRWLFEVGGIKVTWNLVIVTGVFLAGMLGTVAMTYGFESRVRGLRGVGTKGQAFVDFLIDVEAELRKVAWPSRKDLVNSTWIVIVTMVVFALFLLFMDQVFQLAMRGIGAL